MDKMSWTVAWFLQAVMWVMNHILYGTQNGTALIVPLAFLIKMLYLEMKDAVQQFTEEEIEEESEQDLCFSTHLAYRKMKKGA